jgi:hypothetical protein
VVVAITGANKTAEIALGPRSDPRIIGGQEVDPAWSYPFLVGITQVGYYCCQCGGSLISREWVLTAAHCIESGQSYAVLVYGHSSRLVERQNHRCTEQIAVAETICHEGYDTDSNEADVCLLRLARAPGCADEMEAAGQFVRLDDGSLGRDHAGTVVTLAGWGLIDEEGSQGPDLMHHVTTKIVPFSDCNTAYGRTLVEGSMICAGEPGGGKDSCQGDSGGPLFVQEAGSFVQIGVVSFGVGCGRAGFPGVYASVAHYLNWITGKITAPPTAPSECANTCIFPADGDCDDGGPGSEYSYCDIGTDCTDCGTRNGESLCYDTCAHSSDGECDDGGFGADYSTCDLGLDCTDCGVRNVTTFLPPSSAQPLPPSSMQLPPPPPSPPPGTSSCVEPLSQCASTCTATSCANCGCAGCAICRAVVVRVVASGSVSDYDNIKSLTGLRTRFALAAQVDMDTVTVSVAAGSVIITAVIEPISATADEIELRLGNLFSTFGASFVLGVDVEEDPTFSREGEGSVLLGLSLPVFMAVVAGAAVGLVILVCVVAAIACCCLGNATFGFKRGASNVATAHNASTPAVAIPVVVAAPYSYPAPADSNTQGRVAARQGR